MDWFKRTGSGQGYGAKVGSPSPSPGRPPHLGRSYTMGDQSPATLTSTPHGDVTRRTSGDRRQQSLDLPPSPIARRKLQMETDPDTCLEVFRSHWSQAQAVMSRNGLSSPGGARRSVQEDVEAVLRYVDQMALLLIEEESRDGGQGPVLEFLLTEDILEQLLSWSTRHAEQADQLRLHQLKMYDIVISQARQEVLIHKPVIRPLLKLLGSCQENENPDIEHFLVLILHQLCVCVTQNKHILELLFDASADHGPAKFLVFSLLITYIHREGDVGQQARDALLLIMSLSSVHDDIGQYISNNSDFCPVLATGLSGLYSSLPRKIEYPSDDWHRLSSDDIVSMPELVQFLNSLDFCNAVVQVANPRVGDQLLVYIYNGFLVPVLGPALHQTSMEEVIAATAYLDLFVRRISEPALIRTFLKFVLTATHDDVNILESLITRISSNSRLCMVTLTLFRTLLELNCEDVMFQLVFKYLIPCTHVMVSQRRAVKDVDLYCKTAQKLLSLRPTCCLTDSGEGDISNDNVSVNSSPPPSPALAHLPPAIATNNDGMTDSPGQKFKRFLLRRSTRSRADSTDSTASSHRADSRSSSPERVNGTGCVSQSLGGSSCSQLETSYIEYLKAVRVQIEDCAAACQCWSLPYDGDNPPIDSLDGGGAVPNVLEAPKVSCSTNGSPIAGSHLVNGASGSPVRDLARPTGVENGTDVTLRRTSEEKSTATQEVTSDDLRRPQTAQRLSYTESVTSDVDSAFSSSSAHTDAPASSLGQSPSRGDSPLNDNFHNANFSAFLLSLKRVKTPVEYCDNVEDSFQEIDSIVNELKKTAGSLTSIDKAPGDGQLNDATDIESSDLTHLDSELNIDNELTENSNVANDKSSTTQSVPCDAIKSTDDVKSGFIRRSASPLLTPLKKTGNPNIGPFLSTLLGRLELMMQNTLYVNLLLTGVLMRLSCYPQPLLHSFLLNHSLVFQPTVKSLIQVLGSVKQKVDCFALTVKNFDEMLTKARLFLLWREETYLHSIGETSGRRDSTASFPGALSQHRPEAHREKRSAFRDLFRRGQTPTRSRANEPRLRLLSDKQGFRYVNQKSPPVGTPESEQVVDQMEALKTKNAVYCALVLDEFLKELAAISQEHAVSCL